MNDNRVVEILLVEDNPGDVDLTREALTRGKVIFNLNVVSDGQDAMNFLHRKGSFADAPTPDVILLDLNLPGKDGREVLVEIKQDDELKHVPVIIMTSSQAEEDIARSYACHANCYVTKPVDLQQFLKVVASVEEFWLSVVKLPPRPAR